MKLVEDILNDPTTISHTILLPSFSTPHRVTLSQISQHNKETFEAYKREMAAVVLRKDFITTWKDCMKPQNPHTSLPAAKV